MVRAVVANLGEAIQNSQSSYTYLPKIAAPYTTVVNRAQVTDFAADGLPKFGIDRRMIQQLVEIQGEQGPNGERAWKALNDFDDAVRFVGGWYIGAGTSGQSAYTDVTGSYAEITFYGSGLNLLVYTDATARDISLSVDGVAQSNISNVGSSVLGLRNYSMNRVISVPNISSTGMHTVKVGIVNGTFIIFGYEVINSASTIFLPSAQGYIGSKKLSASSSTTAYNSGFTNQYQNGVSTVSPVTTKGGHVLMYQKSDGTYAKDIVWTDSTASYLASASHANEEILRTYHWREFSCGRHTVNAGQLLDDFGSLTTTQADRTFTLDDGTTTLTLNDGLANIVGSNTEGISLNLVGSFWVLTFVGTGLDIVNYNNSVAALDTHSLHVDGVSQGNLSVPANTIQRTTKLCSGLPYGTHTVKIERTASVSTGLTTCSFIVYAPKTPTLPSGSIPLSDYFLMASFVNNTTTAVRDIISSGVLRKFSIRESLFSGTWAVQSLDPGYMGGFNIRSNTATNYVEHTFFGTGCNLRLGLANAAQNLSFTINGSSNLTGISSFVNTGSGLTYTASAGTLTGTLSGHASPPYNAAILTITGLTLGVHKIRITQNNTGVDYLYADALDVITPVHAYKEIGPARMQNTSLIGSSAVRDLRSFSPVQISESSKKAWCQAVGIGGSPTLSSPATTYIPLPDLSCTIKTTGNPIEVSVWSNMNNSVNSYTSSILIFINGVLQAPGSSKYLQTGNATFEVSFRRMFYLPAGTHRVEVYWWNENVGMTVTAVSANRSLTVREL